VIHFFTFSRYFDHTRFLNPYAVHGYSYFWVLDFHTRSHFLTLSPAPLYFKTTVWAEAVSWLVYHTTLFLNLTRSGPLIFYPLYFLIFKQESVLDHLDFQVSFVKDKPFLDFVDPLTLFSISEQKLFLDLATHTTPRPLYFWTFVSWLQTLC